MTEAAQDYSNNNIRHAFFSAKTFPSSHAVLGLFQTWIPYVGGLLVVVYEELKIG